MINNEYIEEYIKNEGIYLPAVLKEIGKSKNHLQPIFEAFTNSLEATLEILLSSIKIKIFHTKKLFEEKLEFNKIVIEDNGEGFNSINFDRFLRYLDDRKGKNNKGSGRIQFVHFFKESEFTSNYKENDIFLVRKFKLSKSKQFIDNNSIVYHYFNKENKNTENKTSLTFTGILENKDQSFYDELRIQTLKKELIKKYLLYFCSHRENMPNIILEQYVNEIHIIENDLLITSSDIPKYDKEIDLKLRYSKILGNKIVNIDKNEILKLTTFIIPKDNLEKNEIKLTSKEEIIENSKIDLLHLKPKDDINGNRYLFLISGDYIDNKDDNVRGNIKIPTKKEFKDSNGDDLKLFLEEEILLDDIKEITNFEIFKLYEEIARKNEDKFNNLETLQSMYLLNPKTIEALKNKISINDSDEDILNKVYKADAEIIAKGDAEIKQRIENLTKLNTSTKDFETYLNKEINELVKAIPLQNRTTLTHYVARRKLVLELFDKIINKKLDEQVLRINNKDFKNIDEKLLHNLFFKQYSNKSEDSDLWLINEEFIYFNGISESTIGNISYNGKKILKEDNEMTQEEKDYRFSKILEIDKYNKRPDILLFPEEGKCIIIELKSIDSNPSEYLDQITNYASIIKNLCKDEFDINTFYGYLIGEKIDYEEILDKVPFFQEAQNFDYIFRPNFPLRIKFNKKPCSLYTEVIQYKTLLKRAKQRNQIFIKKLTENLEILS